jgi:hypothetical protein
METRIIENKFKREREREKGFLLLESQFALASVQKHDYMAIRVTKSFGLITDEDYLHTTLES